MTARVVETIVFVLISTVIFGQLIDKVDRAEPIGYGRGALVSITYHTIQMGIGYSLIFVAQRVQFMSNPDNLNLTALAGG